MGHDVGLLPGTLDLLILKAVSLGPLHGYGVLLRIGQMSGGALEIEQGALYPALYRLEGQGLLDTEWGISRQQPKGQVLPADRGGPKAPPRRNSRMAAVVGRDGHGVESQAGGDLTCARLDPSSGDSAILSVLHERNVRWAMSSRFIFRVAPRTWSARASPRATQTDRRASSSAGSSATRNSVATPGVSRCSRMPSAI